MKSINSRNNQKKERKIEDRGAGVLDADLTLIISRGNINYHNVFHSHYLLYLALGVILLSRGTLPLAQGFMAKSEDQYFAGGV